MVYDYQLYLDFHRNFNDHPGYKDYQSGRNYFPRLGITSKRQSIQKCFIKSLFL